MFPLLRSSFSGRRSGGTKDNHDGTYSATFYQQTGTRFEPVVVTVDDEFPKVGRRVAYAQIGDREGSRELWVMAAEKAFAKFKGGSYRKIDGGFPHEAMMAITGKKAEAYTAQAVSFDKLARWAEGKNAIVVGTPGKKINDPLYDKDILVTGHAYWVEKINRRSRTVTIANPWGFEEKHVTLTEDQFHTVLDSVFKTDFR